MKNLALAMMAMTALGLGAAFAQDDGAANAPPPGQSSQVGSERLAYATTTRGQVSIYAKFREDG